MDDASWQDMQLDMAGIKAEIEPPMSRERYKVLSGLVVAYSDLTGKYGPDSDEAMAFRRKHWNDDEFLRYAAATDRLRKRFSTKWKVTPSTIGVDDAYDPDALEAIADELTEFHHSARADSLRVIAKRQRAAMAKARGESQPETER